MIHPGNFGEINSKVSFVFKTKEGEENFKIWIDKCKEKDMEKKISLSIPGYPTENSLVLFQSESACMNKDPDLSEKKKYSVRKNDFEVNYPVKKKLLLDCSICHTLLDKFHTYKNKLFVHSNGVEYPNPFILYDFEEFARKNFIHHKKLNGLNLENKSEFQKLCFPFFTEIFKYLKSISEGNTSFFQPFIVFGLCSLSILMLPGLEINFLSILNLYNLVSGFFLFKLGKIILQGRNSSKIQSEIQEKVILKTNSFYISKILIIGILRTSNLFAT